ncbi:hypothetical protein ON010_g10775 [Phytophthora cinnamomi]|nr:hypothetical protein ON010_g10775 [Phytophthora cinnamomi]
MMILRCFPHCCPDHAPRSYCGCSLQVLVTFETVEDATTASQNQDLVVCARFESTATGAASRAGDVVGAMERDDIVALPSSALLPSGDTESDWVRAEKAGDSYQQNFPPVSTNTILYVLNNHRSPQWYYGYDSGSTKTQREMKHVLAVYALALHPLSARRGTPQPIARLATVVARHPSPSFTMVSYRRQSNIRRRERESARDSREAEGFGEISEVSRAGCADDVMPKQSASRISSTLEQPDKTGIAIAQALMSMDVGRATSHLQVDAECDSAAGPQADSRTFEQLGIDDENPFSSVPLLGMGSPQRTPRCQFCQDPLLLPPHAPNHDTLERLQMVLLLLLFMRHAPLGNFRFHFNEMDSRIRRNWLSSLSPLGRLRPSGDALARKLIAHVRSSFSVACFLPGEHLDTAPSVNGHLREKIVLRSCANLLLDAFSSSRVQQILSSIGGIRVDAGASQNVRTVSESCELFGQLVADLFDEFTHLLADRCNYHSSRFGVYSPRAFVHGYANIPHLVDDMLSLIYPDLKYQSLRSAASALLLRKNYALETAAHGLFRAFVLQQHQACNDPDHYFSRRTTEHTRTQSIFKQEKVERTLSSTLEDRWTRRWFLEPASISITPAVTEADGIYSLSGPSLLSVLGLVQIFTSVDMALENLQLSIGSSMSYTDQDSAVSGTVFVLDGQMNRVKTFPNGMVVAAGAAVFGDCWGLNEYQGQISDDRSSIELLLTVLPSSESSHRADTTGNSNLAQRVVIHATLEEEQAGENSFSVLVKITTARGASSRRGDRVWSLAHEARAVIIMSSKSTSDRLETEQALSTASSEAGELGVAQQSLIRSGWRSARRHLGDDAQAAHDVDL